MPEKDRTLNPCLSLIQLEVDVTGRVRVRERIAGMCRKEMVVHWKVELSMRAWWVVIWLNCAARNVCVTWSMPSLSGWIHCQHFGTGRVFSRVEGVPVEFPTALNASLAKYFLCHSFWSKPGPALDTENSIAIDQNASWHNQNSIAIDLQQKTNPSLLVLCSEERQHEKQCNTRENPLMLPLFNLMEIIKLYVMSSNEHSSSIIPSTVIKKVFTS